MMKYLASNRCGRKAHFPNVRDGKDRIKADCTGYSCDMNKERLGDQTVNVRFRNWRALSQMEAQCRKC